ncbi:hypothetical protein F5B17DRAFT_443701 [Nemania serpens]|nr:hypothetical protein F5B17DRAFT_443701 [Nemania serpens]
MPTYFSLQGLGHVTPCPSHGPCQGQTCQHLPANDVAPSKRPASEDDDEIEFISENPVKRRKISRKQPVTPISVQPAQPAVPFSAASAAPAAPTDTYTASTVLTSLAPAAMEMPSGDLRDMERRLSTGMVGLPSDIHAMELTYGLRGMSMPVLERFVLDQPFRKPRPPSPPELSPKQLPSMTPPANLDAQKSQHVPGAFDCAKSSSPLTVFSSPNHAPGLAKKPAIPSDSTKTGLDTDKTRPSEPVRPNSQASSVQSSQGRRTGSRSTPMPPSLPTLPYSQAHHDEPTPRANLRPSENHHDHNSPAHPQKLPCQISLPPHLMPHPHYHPPWGQHLHPQMMTMPTSNMHQIGSNFAPVIMPINGSPFMPLPSHPQPQPLAQQVSPQQRKTEVEGEKQSTPKQFKKKELPQTTEPKSTITSPKATPSSIKPPASLIQPTYRKPSPNLIVDVAETCQEKFPFEEVAKRHKVPVDKVFDVFAAIIQVPLLRCPTDRRRQGKLATARVKEYNKAKEDIRQHKPEDGRAEAVFKPADIAQRLGQVDFPEGFTLGGTS